MRKQLVINHDGRDFTLEFTRDSVRRMEKSGFKVSDLTDYPMTYLPDLFAGAFIANHRFVKREDIDEIYRTLPNKEELVGKLAEMYNDPIAELFSEPSADEGNATWTANW